MYMVKWTLNNANLTDCFLKVLMDAATTESLFKLHPETSELMLKYKTDTVVRDATVIEQLILEWQIWERCDISVTELLFSALDSLIRDDHVYQSYNVKQYTAVHFVNKIFRIYQVCLKHHLNFSKVTNKTTFVWQI